MLDELLNNYSACPVARQKGASTKPFVVLAVVMVVDVVVGRDGVGDDIGLGRSRETEHRCGQAAGDQSGKSELLHFAAFFLSAF